MQLGLIGLGKMGGNMAERLRLAGHQVVGFDFNAEAVGRLTQSGNVGASSLEEMAQKLEQALKDGYEGLWASGDMTWEMGPDKDFSKLVEYECHLEEFFREHPEMGGICQYHADSIPPEVIRHGYLAHRSLFINETLSLVNPHYVRRQTLRDTIPIPVVEAAILRLCHADAAD